MKNNIDFFSHETDSFEHRKFLILRTFYGGAEGWAMEGRFWALNCLIGKADGCMLDTTKKGEKARVARVLDLSMTELDKFLGVLREEAELIIDHNGVIMTQQTQDDLKRAMKPREAAQERRERTSRASVSIVSGTYANDLEKLSHENDGLDRIGIDKSSRANSSSQKSPPREEPPARPPAIHPVQEKINTSPFRVFFTSGQLGALEDRCKARAIDPVAFVGYAVDRVQRQRPRNPAGLLLKGLLQFDEWLEEFAAPPAQFRLTKAVDIIPEPAPCSCGGRIRADLWTGVGKCVECGKFYEFDRCRSNTWLENITEAIISPRPFSRVTCSV